MSANTRAKLSTSYSEYQKKFGDPDADLRQQALIDLAKDINSVPASSSTRSRTKDDCTYADEHVEKQFTSDVLKLVLNDSNSEVKNEAVKCLETMTGRSRPVSIGIIIKLLLDGLTSDEEETRNIAPPALKKVVQAIPRDTAQLAQNIEAILKRTFQILDSSARPDPQVASELLQVAKDIYLRFADKLVLSPGLQESSLDSLISILSTSRNASIRKRATEAIPALVATNPGLFSAKFKDQLEQGITSGGEAGNAWVGLVAALAKEQGVVAGIGGLVGSGRILDEILKHTSDPEQVEATEAAFVAIETLIYRCPTEIRPYVERVLQRSLELVKYDPNYVELDDDDDVEMNDDDEDEDDDYEDDAYSDEEDISWKVRRSAAKVVYALIGTRNDLLVDFYKIALPTLIVRFAEREESVRLEILASVETLLRQTAQARTADAVANGRNKRKRSEEMDEDGVEETALACLTQVHGKLLQATLKQLASKSVATRQQCFELLRQTDEAQNGGLEGEAEAICSAAATAVRSVDSSASSSLAMSALAFLATFFRHHSGRVYASYLNTLVPAIVRCMKDKLQRVNFEAFSAATALAQSLRPQGSSSPLAVNYSTPVQALFAATTEVLGDTSVDGEVRERALDTLGHLLEHEGDALSKDYGTAFSLISTRLTSEATAVTAVQVIGRIAASPLCKGKQFDSWLLEVLPEVVTALRKTRRTASKNAEFSCLQSVLTRVGRNLPADTADALVAELKQFIDAPMALSTISLILSLQPSSVRAIEQQILPETFQLLQNTDHVATIIDSLVAFYASYTEANPSAAAALVSTCVDNIKPATPGAKLPDATTGGTISYTSTARCVGVVAEKSQGGLDGILSGFQQIIKGKNSGEAELFLALSCIGEIGRSIDLGGHADLFKLVLGHFESESESIRTAAASAAGNLAVGSPNVFLPELLKQIEAGTGAGNRLFLLHALKEVTQHSSAAQLESIADLLWTPLFDDKDDARKTGKKGAMADEKDLGDDGIRNVKAACIGKLTTTAPAKYLPQLQRLISSSARNKAMVAAAVRYTFIDTSSAYDELIAPIIVDFLSLMHDENVIVRRLSLASLNAAIQNKPHLIIDRLASLQPLLYEETVVKKELQREVQMGPWKVIEDDGLENRKTAYETMYTLLGTCFSKIDLPTFTERVMAALKDVNEVKILGLMLLLRLAQLAPASVLPRLDEVAESLKVIMKDVEVKDDTVKQDLERKEEMQRSTLRTAVPLYRMSTPNQAPVFHSFISSLLSKDEWKDFRSYQA